MGARINAYQCGHHFLVWMELAAIEHQQLQVVVEPRTLIVRGHRDAPQPCEEDATVAHVLALEIKSGRFERRIDLPQIIDPQRVTAEQRSGLLWIHLPIMLQS